MNRDSRSIRPVVPAATMAAAAILWLSLTGPSTAVQAQSSAAPATQPTTGPATGPGQLPEHLDGDSPRPRPWWRDGPRRSLRDGPGGFDASGRGPEHADKLPGGDSGDESEAATGPAKPSPAPDTDDAGPRRPYGGFGMAGPRQAFEPITDEEWIAATEFFRQHSPNRAADIDALIQQRQASGTPTRVVERMRNRIGLRYRMIETARREYPALHENLVRQVRLEDDAYSALKQLGGGDDPELRGRLRNTLTELVNLRLRQRELRLERLQATIDRERQRIESDRGRIDELAADEERRLSGPSGRGNPPLTPPPAPREVPGARPEPGAP